MLIAISFDASSHRTAETKAYASGMAAWVTESIMRDYADADTEMVVFDDFAQWYTDGGYEVAPWLELLDLSKWVLSKS